MYQVNRGMNTPVKVTLYVLLALIAGVSGYFAISNFGRMMSRAGDRTSELERIEPERKPPAETSEEAPQATNELPNPPALANAASVLTNAPAPVETNAMGPAEAPATAGTGGAAQAAGGQPAPPSAGTAPPSAPEAKPVGRIGLWTGVFVLSLIGLGLLIASDVSHYLGNRALKVLYNDEGEGQQNPEYERAEELWANGKHLEAIQLMREYLAKNPREQHVAIRIAEIYEKDLKNNLAAALEYEEVLKHKLQPERWAWAAIHLCNLYFRLSQEQKGFALLRRIVKEHPGTAAAGKARKRLEQLEGSEFSTELPADDAPPPRPEPGRAGPGSHLPAGFRPKK